MSVLERIVGQRLDEHVLTGPDLRGLNGWMLAKLGESFEALDEVQNTTTLTHAWGTFLKIGPEFFAEQ
jgi:hypothetical protein